jgi:hypothetical protein
MWDLRVNASYNSGIEAQAKLITYQENIKNAVEYWRVRIVQQVNIFWNCKFLVNSQSLNWNNKACFREELPLGSLGSKKLATLGGSLTKWVVTKILKSAGTKLRHASQSLLYIANFYGSSLSNSKSKLPKIRVITKTNIELISDHLSKWSNWFGIKSTVNNKLKLVCKWNSICEKLLT